VLLVLASRRADAAAGWPDTATTAIARLQALGVAFVSLNERIDATTPAGKLQMHILGAIAEFERVCIAERVKAGLQRASAQGKRLGRPRKVPSAITVPGGSVRAAARVWGVSKSTAARWIRGGQVHAPVAVID
jgi:DNA invertase Pin-like site-specific DNA recombinase